jgi:DNA-binding LacI/PurR family transcriptional regulator
MHVSGNTGKTSAGRQEQLLEELRTQIITGRLKPGERLPNRADIKQQYDVSNDTIQWAFDRLKEDGFVVARRGHGSFVAEAPPHTCQYGITFWSNPADPIFWRRIDAALLQEILLLEHSTSDRIRGYYNLNHHPDTGDLQELHEDISRHRLAGVIYASEFPEGEELLHLSQPPTPGVHLSLPSEGRRRPTVYVDHTSFLRRALEYLADRGRRRVAVLTATGSFWPDHRREAEHLVEQFGMTMHPYWQIRVSPSSPDGADSCMHLLMHEGQNEVPDGLIITDDNLTGHALSGLMAAGVRIAHDLEVVSHSNFPLAGTNGLPICRLGFDTHTILQTCIDLLQRQRNGNAPESTTHLVPAVFEHELQAGNKEHGAWRLALGAL